MCTALRSTSVCLSSVCQHEAYLFAMYSPLRTNAVGLFLLAEEQAKFATTVPRLLSWLALARATVRSSASSSASSRASSGEASRASVLLTEYHAVTEDV